MTDIKDRAREYLAEHSKYSEVFGQTFVAVDTLTAMVEFTEQETKKLREENESLKEQLEKNPCVVTPDWHCSDCLKENEKLKYKEENYLQKIEYKEIVLKEHLQNPFPRSVEDVWKDGAEFGYNKANEWHDLRKDNKDLPKENMKQVMVITNYNECLMGWYCIHQKTWYSSDCPDPQDRIETEDIMKVKVIKWKEIVLPKESE